MKKNLGPWPGIAVYRPGPDQFTILELDIEADESKRDPEFIASLRRALGDKRYRREILRDRTQPAGASFYPDYAQNGGDSRYVMPGDVPLINSPVHRGFDFGYHNPACVWTQVDRTGRLIIIREWKPRGIRTRAFRDGVRFLSGELQLDDLSGDALIHIQRLVDDERYPMPPWFEDPTLRFENWCGPEANKVQAGSEGESATDNLIFREGGIILNPVAHSLKTRETRVRELLALREDGFPGLLLSPWCPLLIEAFRGGLALPKPTPGNPFPTEPKEDGVYEDLHEALGHVIVNVVPIAGNMPKPGQGPVYQGRRRVTQDEVDEAMDGLDWVDHLRYPGE